MLEKRMASEIYIYLKEPKILLNSVPVKASRQTKTMFGLFWELCTVCSGMCLKQITRISHLFANCFKIHPPPLQQGAEIPKQDQY